MLHCMYSHQIQVTGFLGIGTFALCERMVTVFCSIYFPIDISVPIDYSYFRNTALCGNACVAPSGFPLLEIKHISDVY